MNIGELLLLAAPFGVAWLINRKSSMKASQPPASVPVPKPPPHVPVPAPQSWPAPANLPAVPNVPPARVRVDASPGAWRAIQSLIPPGDAPGWLVLATMELGGGLQLPNLPEPDAGGHYPPLGVTPEIAQYALIIGGMQNPPAALVKGVLSDPGRVFAAGALVLKAFYDRAVAIVTAPGPGGELEDVAHIVRLAWLSGPSAFEKILTFRDAPAWYVTPGRNGLSQAEAWDRAWRRWEALDHSG